MSRTVEEWIGLRFGKWTVIAEAPPKSRRYMLCRCDCGTERDVAENHLSRGASKSCGCGRPKGVDHFRYNGNPKSHVLYRSWCNMIQRCCNPKNKQYADYGGRGITIFKPWQEDFWAYAEAVGERPHPGYSIDRIENNKGYEPGNVRWADAKTQSRNRRGRRIVTLDGDAVPLSVAVEMYGANRSTVKWRLKHGQTIQEALRK